MFKQADRKMLTTGKEFLAGNVSIPEDGSYEVLDNLDPGIDHGVTVTATNDAGEEERNASFSAEGTI